MKILLKPVLVIVLAVLCQYGYAAGNETGESPMAKVLKAGKKDQGIGGHGFESSQTYPEENPGIGDHRRYKDNGHMSFGA